MPDSRYDVQHDQAYHYIAQCPMHLRQNLRKVLVRSGSCGNGNPNNETDLSDD